MMIAVMNPEGIAASTRRGFHIQTTPLAGKPELFKAQITAHKEAKASMGSKGDDLRIMMSRVGFCAQNEAEAKDILARAYDYYGRFDNVFTGPGEVENGCIISLPCIQSIEELEKNLLICTPQKMVDKLSEYDDVGVDEFIMNSNLGQPQSQHLEAMERFAMEVIPHFHASAVEFESR
jgi:alkanesulfonate monooxygenase SsuD/methylene tetrahydromethanopterin reductase-like flavin-dependent oxidoreductase (luciferase family)